IYRVVKTSQARNILHTINNFDLRKKENIGKEDTLNTFQNKLYTSLLEYSPSSVFIDDTVQLISSEKWKNINKHNYKGIVFANHRKGKLKNLFQNGVDMVIVKDNFDEVYSNLSSAYSSLEEKKRNRKTAKILKAKEWTFEKDKIATSIEEVDSLLSSKWRKVYKRFMIEKSCVIVANENKLLPFNQLEKRKFRIVSIGKKNPSQFIEKCNLYAPIKS
ncbi:MAG: hypothetical protein GY828_03255, partial [Candidatus Gracilibacteria bacterium]|nr:hypothetical protein [Candidatus Gracilibacteria bacterium]